MLIEDQYRHVLVHGLLQVLVRSVEFLLEQLDLPLEALVRSLALLAVLLCRLQVCELRLRLLEIGVEYRNLVLERRNLLILLEQELLILLVLGFRLVCTRDRVVGLCAEGCQALLQRSAQRDRSRTATFTGNAPRESYP